MPGVADVTPSPDWRDEGIWEDHVDIEIEEDAAPADVAAALSEVNDGFDTTVTIAGHEEDQPSVLEPQGARHVLEEQAAQFLSAVAAFPDADVQVDASGLEISFETGGADPTPVANAARTVHSDPAMNGAKAITIRAYTIPEYGYQLSTSSGIDMDLLTAWEASLDAFDQLRGEAWATSVELDQQHAGTKDVGPARSLTARVYLGSQQPTPAQHGSMLKPVLRTLLADVLKSGTPGDLELLTGSDVLLGLTTDGSEPTRRGTPAWQRWAAPMV